MRVDIIEKAIGKAFESKDDIYSAKRALCYVMLISKSAITSSIRDPSLTTLSGFLPTHNSPTQKTHTSLLLTNLPTPHLLIIPQIDTPAIPKMPHALSRPPLPIRPHPTLHLPQLPQPLDVPLVRADAPLAVDEGVVGARVVEEVVAVGLVGEVLGPFRGGHLVAPACEEGGVVGEGAVGAVVAGGAEGFFVWGRG